MMMSQTYQEAINYLERIITNLHEAVMKSEWCLLKQYLTVFKRMIRDLSEN